MRISLGGIALRIVKQSATTFDKAFFYQGGKSIVKTSIYFLCWGLTASFLFSVVAGCEQSEPDFTRQTYSGGNIIKNGTFDEGLLHWGTIEGEGKGGDYVEVIREDAHQQNYIAIIHSRAHSKKRPGTIYIDHITQGFALKPGDFQQITIRAKVKSQGRVVPIIFVGLYDWSKLTDENANYGVLDEFQETVHRANAVWYTVEFSRTIPATADWLTVGCTGGIPDEKSDLAEQSPESFKVSCDDIEAFLETEKNK
ncbi:MAG: hypothetical protein GY801_10535 [bacterium]|nr:hypothetical protein [bacterium]